MAVPASIIWTLRPLLPMLLGLRGLVSAVSFAEVEDERPGLFSDPSDSTESGEDTGALFGAGRDSRRNLGSPLYPGVPDVVGPADEVEDKVCWDNSKSLSKLSTRSCKSSLLRSS